MKIVLKDKTEIQHVTVGEVRNLIELTMSKEDAVANMSKFMDPEIMSVIEWHHSAWKTIYVGYTRLSHIDNPKENEMRVWMEGQDGASVSEPIALFDDMYMPKGM